MINLTNFEQTKKDLINIGLGFGIFLIYYILSNTIAVPLALFGIDASKLPTIIKSIYIIVYQFVILGIIVLLARKELKENLERFKKEKNNYFKEYFKYWFLLLGLMMLSNYIIMMITESGIANNEQSIRDTFQVNPIYTYIAGVVIAPFLEEMVFRFGIRKIVNSNTLFIIISGFIFGAMHVIGNAEVLSDYLYIIPYSIPGFVFAYIYVKTKNIFTSISMHLFHNGLLMSLQFLLLLLG